jgi:hypothetical protein
MSQGHHAPYAGIDAEVVDHPGPIVRLVSFGTYRVRIAVEEADEARAQAVLDSWSVQARPRVAELARIVALDALVALVPALLVGATLFFAGYWGPIAGILALPVTWLAAMIVLARRRRRHGAVT